jgi:phosphatidylethanolamine-binding protein (PEBP) family uncharacterized protein
VRNWLLVLVVVVAGCASDGRALAPPAEWQTTTTRPLPPTSAPPSEASESGLAISSPDFAPGDIAPVDTTCAGANVFPDLRWENLSAATAEIAMTLSDQTDPEEPLLLWLMAGISPSESGLEAGLLPAGAFETLNDYGNLGYGTPCLENLAEGRRDLQFRIYILDQPSGLAPGDPGNDAWANLNARAVDTASLLMRVDAAL